MAGALKANFGIWHPGLFGFSLEAKHYPPVKFASMSLPPVLFHYFTSPLPYIRTLALQERIHSLQLSLRQSSPSHKDILLLLQHRPVYTSGRRQKEDEIASERMRLEKLGADFASTNRGGQTTYHGPGQLVGYPLLDLGRCRPAVTVRDYVCKIERTLKDHLRTAHGIESVPADHTGVFLDGRRSKIASIGVQVRHRLTTHGFALNVTQEPRAWFDTVVACGLADVKAVSIAGRSASKAEEAVTVEGEVNGIVDTFGHVFGRQMERLRPENEAELGDLVLEIERVAKDMGEWPRAPLTSPVP